MRAEEMNVVDAAIALYHAEQTKSTIRIAVAENDLRQVTRALILSCQQCNTDTHTCPGCGVDIGHFEDACGQCMDDSTSAVVRHAGGGGKSALWAAVEEQDPGIMTRRFVQEPVEPEPEWIPAEWQHVLAGDRVRLGTQEADVTRSNVGVWHTDNSNRYQPRRWEHGEVHVALKHLGDRTLIMAPGLPVEILAGRERAAVLVLQKAFPAVA